MTERTTARNVMETLRKRGFYAACPCCDEEVRLRDCGLFYLDDFTPEAEEIYREMQDEHKQRREALKKRRKRISTSSRIQTEAVNFGAVLEHLAPSLSTFRFACSDCRSVFKPIDYVIFEGLCEDGCVSRILFGDVKTGNSILTSRQRAIRDLVHERRVEFDIYEVNR